MDEGLAAIDRAEATLLADALGVQATALRSLGREPLGAGSVAGFAVTGDDEIAAYVDTSGLPVRAESGLVSQDGTRIWLHPADPHLPALAPVAFPDGAAALLARLGMDGLATIEMVGYRPGRRAVLRMAMTDGRIAWLKVVRPSRTARIVETHDALSTAGLPLPAVRGWSPEGLIVLDAAEGSPASDEPWAAGDLLDAVDSLRDDLAAVELRHPARTSIAGRLDWYVGRLRRTRPHDARIAAIAESATRALAADPMAPPTAIHGDLHLGQLFLAPSELAPRVTALIDVDTAGRGDPAEDAAAFLSHAFASAILTGRRPGAPKMWELAETATERWAGDRRVRALAQVQLLGHALSAAERADEIALESMLEVAIAASVGVSGSWRPPKRGLIDDFEAS